MEKLSKLQKAILILLADPKYSTMPRRVFNQNIYEGLFGQGWVTDAARASLSRAYRRLEGRGFLIRADGCWRLTDRGGIVAVLERVNWLEERDKKVDSETTVGT